MEYDDYKLKYDEIDNEADMKKMNLTKNMLIHIIL